MLALRIGTVKNSKNFLRVVGPARAISAGAEKESRETTGDRQKPGVRRRYPPVLNDARYTGPVAR